MPPHPCPRSPFRLSPGPQPHPELCCGVPAPSLSLQGAVLIRGGTARRCGACLQPCPCPSLLGGLWPHTIAHLWPRFGPACAPWLRPGPGSSLAAFWAARGLEIGVTWQGLAAMRSGPRGLFPLREGVRAPSIVPVPFAERGGGALLPSAACVSPTWGRAQLRQRPGTDSNARCQVC